MPGRNVVKQYGAEHYYHVYSRGVAKQLVFLDAQDYHYFLSLFKRYLSDKPSLNGARMPYPAYGKRIDLLAYCLMPNHVHLLLFQHDERAMIEFMRSLMTSYSMYFNRKYERVGPVFQSRYRASLIYQQSYLEHISRYIHLNPKDWQTYEYSSLPYYLKKQTAAWLDPSSILGLFDNAPGKYLRFVENYKEHRQMFEELKWELANG